MVVVTRDRPDELACTLRHLRALAEQPDVIVVDNASRADLSAAVAGTGARLVRMSGNAGAAGRNVGVALARTPYVAFSDDDSWWRDGSLARACDVMSRHGGVGMVAGRVLLGDGREDPACTEMARSPLPRAPGEPMVPVLGFIACGAVVRRSAFLAVGGFQPGLGVGGEETLLAMRLADAGHLVGYAPAVVAEHRPSAVRDRAQRNRLVWRNRLLTAWLGRPLPAALGVTLRVAGRALADPEARDGLRAAGARLGWAMSRRMPVGPRVERGLRALGGARPTGRWY